MYEKCYTSCSCWEKYLASERFGGEGRINLGPMDRVVPVESVKRWGEKDVTGGVIMLQSCPLHSVRANIDKVTTLLSFNALYAVAI